MIARLVILPFIAMSAAGAQTSVIGVWRFERAVVAPWLHPGSAAPDTRTWIGSTVRFDGDRATGPGALTCAKGSWAQAPQSADAMFQGNLPAPARKSAATLGVTHFPVPGVRLDCSSGSFDFHRVDQSTLLLALNNVIWTLSRSPGALAVVTAPNGVVQLFLEHHFAGDMGFDSASVAAKQEWLADPLRAAITKYLRRPASPNEEPAVDGDPFTDSQEYPTRFAVGATTITGQTAAVPVRFSDGYRDRTVTYVLRQQGVNWRIADIRLSGAESLTHLLK